MEEMRDLYESRINDIKNERDYLRERLDFLTGHAEKRDEKKDREAVPQGVPASRSRGLAYLEAERRKAYWAEINKRNEEHSPDGATSVS